MLNGKISPGFRSVGESAKSVVDLEDVVDSLTRFGVAIEVVREWEGATSEVFKSSGPIDVAGVVIGGHVGAGLEGDNGASLATFI